MRRNVLSVAVLLVLSQGRAVQADVKPHALITEGMVLQQGMPAPIWGTAEEGEKVLVRFQDHEATATTKDGKWMVRLEKLKAGGPFEMTISGKNTIQLKNVMVGEVWICSGQSNMEWPVSHSADPEKTKANSKNPKIHLFTVKKASSPTPLTDVTGQWAECGPDSVMGFSAVAYFFGRDLQKALDVPVGLIHTSWGGTPAELWTSERVLTSTPELKNLKGSGLYNGMIAPLIPFAIRGAIWYQGESNAGQAYLYRTLFSAMIKNWREDWKQGDFPFLFVQLAPFSKIVTEPEESAWAELREAQLLTSLNVPQTAMAVITDVGDANDIHPKKKEPVGGRLALAARAVAYGQNIIFSGPIYDRMTVEGSKAVLSFKSLGGGLVAKDGSLAGFTIAGEDHKFYNATAEIQGNQVVVSSDKVAKPVAVRYGWANCPVVNLWNKEGLPASPFRTDDFAMVTGPKRK